MKYQLGEVVYLKSAWASGGVPGTIVESAEEDGVRPDRYQILLQSRNGEMLSKFEAPEAILISEDEAQDSVRGKAQ